MPWRCARCCHCTTPTSPLNVSGPETISIRWLAEAFGERLGKAPVLQGGEAATAWLTNPAQRAGAVRLSHGAARPHGRLGRRLGRARRAAALGKDTHYDARDGSY